MKNVVPEYGKTELRADLRSRMQTVSDYCHLRNRSRNLAAGPGDMLDTSVVLCSVLQACAAVADCAGHVKCTQVAVSNRYRESVAA